jgi:xylulokinase
MLTRTVGARNLVNLTGETAHEGATAVKLLWLRENERRVWHDLALILPPKDFLRYRLTGMAATCPFDATASLLGKPLPVEVRRFD